MLNPRFFPQRTVVFLRAGQGFQHWLPSWELCPSANAARVAENSAQLDNSATTKPVLVLSPTDATEPLSKAESHAVTWQDDQTRLTFDVKLCLWPYRTPPLTTTAMALTQRAPNAADSAAQIWAQAPALTVVHAQSLGDAELVIRMVRGNATVVLNVEALEPSLRRRVVDVIGGGLCAIDAKSTEIGNHVWLLKPVLAGL